MLSWFQSVKWWWKWPGLGFGSLTDCLKRQAKWGFEWMMAKTFVMVWLGCVMLVTSRSQVWFYCSCCSWTENVFGHCHQPGQVHRDFWSGNWEVQKQGVILEWVNQCNVGWMMLVCLSMTGNAFDACHKPGQVIVFGQKNAKWPRWIKIFCCRVMLVFLGLLSFDSFFHICQ